MNDSILQEDIEQIVHSNIPFDQLSGCTIFVTGATGLIGSLLVKSLLQTNMLLHTDICVVALVRNLEKAKKIFRNHLNTNRLSFYEGDIAHSIQYAGKIDYIIHGANSTDSKFFVSNPVDTIMTTVNGTRNILEFAREKQIQGMIYLSSLEIYGIPDGQSELISENQYGYIDPLAVRSSYSEGKRMAECLCVSYAQQYHVPVKIARLAQTFGAGVSYNDPRVFADFARSIIEKRNIILHTKGKTVRSYCYTSDAIRAILFILLRGETAEAYNVTNMKTAISISDMAHMVCDLFPESGSIVEYDTPKEIHSFGYNPEMIIRLDSSKLVTLGWQAQIDLQEMFRRLISSMRDM